MLVIEGDVNARMGRRNSKREVCKKFGMGSLKDAERISD